MNPFDLKGKVALVTGSTMGIGEATARVLAQAGAHVVISSRKQADCDRVAGEFRESGLSADVTRPASNRPRSWKPWRQPMPYSRFTSARLLPTTSLKL